MASLRMLSAMLALPSFLAVAHAQSCTPGIDLMILLDRCAAMLAQTHVMPLSHMRASSDPFPILSSEVMSSSSAPFIVLQLSFD
jgi:hypothetical protein